MPSVAILAIKNQTNLDLLQLLNEWYPKANQEFIAIHTRKPNPPGTQPYVDLFDKNISSIYGWDFTQQNIESSELFLDLSFNKIKKINDKSTAFGNLSVLRLNNNQIGVIDLRDTTISVLYLWNNNISSNSFASHQIQFPHRVSRLSLFSNPIVTLANYSFPEGESLYVSHCDIVSLHNVCFKAKRIYLDDNPLQIIKEVTFKNTERLSMQNCNVSRSKFLSFDIRFVGRNNVEVRLDNAVIYDCVIYPE